jgi:hypothetical protein
MKKIIRLTESELISVVKKIIKENEEEWISSMEDIEGESDFSKIEIEAIKKTRDITEKLPEKEKNLLKKYIEDNGFNKFNDLVSKVSKKNKIEFSEAWKPTEDEATYRARRKKENEEDDALIKKILEEDVITSLLYKFSNIAGLAFVPLMYLNFGIAIGVGAAAAISRLFVADKLIKSHQPVAKKRKEEEIERQRKLKQKEEEETKQKELQKESRIINSIRKKIKRYE